VVQKVQMLFYKAASGEIKSIFRIFHLMEGTKKNETFIFLFE